MNQSISLSNSAELPPPAGHYSYSATVGNLTFISGILPIDETGAALSNASFAQQTTQIFKNLECCLNNIGATKEDLVQVRIYVTDITLWPEFNTLYAEWLGAHRPARAVAGVNELHYGCAIEVEAVALNHQ